MGIILSAALLPVIILLWYTYRHDTTYKEPFPMLLKAFFFGILAALLDILVANLLPTFIPHPVSSPLNDALYTAFVEAAIPEEFCKLLMLYLCIWRSPHFDEYYDGPEYAAFVGLGFAGIENVLYVLYGGLGVALGRGLLAVPAHFFFAIFMGYFFALARFRRKRRKYYMFWAYIIPVILHGIYDGILMFVDNLSKFENLEEVNSLSGTLYIVFFIFFFLVWRMAIKRVKRMSGQ